MLDNSTSRIEVQMELNDLIEPLAYCLFLLILIVRAGLERKIREISIEKKNKRAIDRHTLPDKIEDNVTPVP